VIILSIMSTNRAQIREVWVSWYSWTSLKQTKGTRNNKIIYNLLKMKISQWGTEWLDFKLPLNCPLLWGFTEYMYDFVTYLIRGSGCTLDHHNLHVLPHWSLLLFFNSASKQSWLSDTVNTGFKRGHLWQSFQMRTRSIVFLRNQCIREISFVT